LCNWGSFLSLLLVFKESFKVLTDNIELNDLTNRQEDRTSVGKAGVRCSSCPNSQRLNTFIIGKLVLNYLELSKVSRCHHHRVQVVRIVPHATLDLLSRDRLKFVVTKLGVKLTV
jgi:hypothetical protein